MNDTVAQAAPPSNLNSHGPPAARIVNGTKVYETAAPNVVALDQVNLDFADGHFTAIMGPSGSGNAVDTRDQTTVIVTHDPVAAAWADRVIFMVDGQAHHEIGHRI